MQSKLERRRLAQQQPPAAVWPAAHHALGPQRALHQVCDGHGTHETCLFRCKWDNEAWREVKPHSKSAAASAKRRRPATQWGEPPAHQPRIFPLLLLCSMRQHALSKIGGDGLQWRGKGCSGAATAPQMYRRYTLCDMQRSSRAVAPTRSDINSQSFSPSVSLRSIKIASSVLQVELQ